MAAPINGTRLKVYVDGAALAHSTEFTLSRSHSPREITSKDSAGWSESREGLRESSLSGSLWTEINGTNNMVLLDNAMNNRTLVNMQFSTELSGERFYSAFGFITSLEIGAGVEETATTSFEFQATGPVQVKTQT